MVFLNLARQGNDDVLDGLMKLDRVVDAVVEPLAIAECVLDEIGEPRFAGDLDPELFHFVEEAIEHVAVFQPAPGGQLPGLLANRPVCCFEKRGHLRERSFLLAKCHRHGTNRLLVLLFLLGELGLARNIGIAKQAAAILERAVEHEVAIAGQLDPKWRVEIARADRVLDRLEPGLDVTHIGQIGGLSFGVIGLTGHRDVALRPLPHRRLHSIRRPSQSTARDLGAGYRFGHELLVPRFDLLPGREFKFRGKPLVRERFGYVTTQRCTPLLLHHGIDCCTSHAPRNSSVDMIVVAIIKTRAVVATASACANNPLASPSEPIV